MPQLGEVADGFGQRGEVIAPEVKFAQSPKAADRGGQGAEQVVVQAELAQRPAPASRRR